MLKNTLNLDNMDDSGRARLIKLKFGKRYQRLISKDSGSSGIKSGHVLLKRGGNIGEHSTEAREEIIIILKGKGKAIINKNQCLDIDKNSVLYIPPKTIHDIKNTSLRTLEYIFITAALCR